MVSRSRITPSRTLIVLAGVGVALFGLGFIAFDLARSYQRDIDEAERASRNLVVVLEAHTGRTIQAVDQALAAIAAHPETAAAIAGRDRAYYQANLMDRLIGMPQLLSLTVIDANGQPIASTFGDPLARPALSDRDYFEALRAGDAGPTLFIGSPTLGRTSGRWFLGMTRRITGPRGEFLGVVLGALDPAFFANLYRNIDIGPNGNVTLFRTDGTIVARWPAHEGFIGKSAASGVLFREHLPKAAEGTIRLTTVIDGRDILLSYKTIAGRPFVINVAFELRDVLHGWRKSVFVYAGIAFGILLLSASAVVLLLRVRQRNDSLQTAKRIADDALRDMQVAAAESRGRTDFFAAMSHELRTPLNGIIGYCQMLRLGLAGAPANPRFDEYLRNIETSGNHLLATVNDILDLSKITEGQMKLREEEIGVGELLSECAAIARGMGGVATQEIDLRGDALIAMLRADPLRLKQIVLNLLSNAIKVADHGDKIGLYAQRDPDGGIVIAVVDNGPGMDEAEIRNALKPWSRPDVAVQRSFARTGLGLSLSKALAELHGGSLEIVSAPGSGTSARIHLPASRTMPVSLVPERAEHGP